MKFARKIKDNKFIRKMYHGLLAAYMASYQKIKGIKKKAVFISLNGRTYSDNPKAISEALHEKDDSIEIVWIIRNAYAHTKKIPDYVRVVEYSTRAYISELATAKYWIDNEEKQPWLYKSKHQKYIQTWHGDRSFKKILLDSSREPNSKRKMFESKHCDLYVSGSMFGAKMARSAFGFCGEIMCEGCPRNDALVDNKKRLEINKITRDILRIPYDAGVLMFAPTFRHDDLGGKQKYNGFEMLPILHELECVTGKIWYGLLRTHFQIDGFEQRDDSEKIYDVTKYEDMTDLLCATDLLITDYSSSAADFILTEKPVVLYQQDINEYESHERKLYFNVKEAGFQVAYDMNELLHIIKGVFEGQISLDYKKINNFFGLNETGKASEAVAKWIIHCDNED